jgi:hypothetical protein
MDTPLTEAPRQQRAATTDSSATDHAKAKAQEAGGAAKEQAQQAAGQAKGALRSQVEQRSTQAGEQIGGVASDVRSVGDQLREQGKDRPAKLADQAADRAEQLGSYLRDNDADRILGDVEDFGRRQPWAIIAGGVALGFAASRFLKASSSRRYEQRDSQGAGRLPASTGGGLPRTQKTYTEPPVTAAPVTNGLDTPVTTGMPGGTRTA